MTHDPSIKKSDKQLWIEGLERAAEKGIIFHATGTYIKLRRFSPRRYHSSMNSKMVKEITRVVKLKTKAYNKRGTKTELARTCEENALEGEYFRGVAAIE